MRHDTIPSVHEGEFKAMAQGRTDYIVDVFLTNTLHGKFMTIAGTEEAIYISKEQAKAFFDLIENDHQA
jgi:hypothetical protein